MEPGRRVMYVPTGRRAIFAGRAENGESIIFFASIVPPRLMAALTQGRKADFVAWAAKNLRESVQVSPESLRVTGGDRQPERAATAS